MKLARPLLALLVLASVTTTPRAHADVPYSTDPLPSIQLDGTGWAQAIVGDLVFVGGAFSHASAPAGQPGQSWLRQGLLAYNIRTGQLDFRLQHQVTGGPVLALAVSPDQTKLYAGGTFTAVDNWPRQGMALFDLDASGNATLNPATFDIRGTVYALAASNGRVWACGQFDRAKQWERKNVAAFYSDGIVTPWNAYMQPRWVDRVDNDLNDGVDREPWPEDVSQCRGIVLAGGRVILGGTFNAVGGTHFYGTAALNTETGAAQGPWAAWHRDFAITQQLPDPPTKVGVRSGSYISSVTTAGDLVFITGADHLNAKPGTFEGRAALRVSDGSFVSGNFCRGDTYGAFPLNGILYSVGHAHSCAEMGTFRERDGKHFLLAETFNVAGVNGTAENWWSYPDNTGWPRSEQLPFYPQFVPGTQADAGKNVIGNDEFLSVVGNFPAVIRPDGTSYPQANLVRYRVPR